MKVKDILHQIIKRNKTEKIKYIYEYLNDKKLNPELYIYNNTVKNIEVKNTDDDTKKDIIIFAHHDISLKTDQGANDNGSSVSVLMKLCDHFHEIKSNYNIKAVFNDNEELLGAIGNASYDKEYLQKIITNVGSYMYLKNYKNKQNIKHIVILELCGIGNSIYIANKSGNIKTDHELCKKLTAAGKNNSIGVFNIDIPSTDMISVKAFGLSGTVIGAIPEDQVTHYMEESRYKDNITPPVWNNIHSKRDNIFAIHEHALDMMYKYLLDLVQSIN